MVLSTEISMHHIRVDVKAFGNYFSYEYDVPEDVWSKYEVLNGQKRVSCFKIPNCLYNRLHDEQEEPRFYSLASYELEEFHVKIVRANVCTEIRYN